MYDAYGLQVLDYPECVELLRQNKVGRFVFIDHMLLAVHPVAYVFDGVSVVFQTNGGAKLDAATKHDLAAFEIDYIDPILDGAGPSLSAATPSQSPMRMRWHD